MKIWLCGLFLHTLHPWAHGSRSLWNKTWFTADDQDRWQACGIPATLSFQTEPALGLEMIAGAPPMKSMAKAESVALLPELECSK
jgi:hypothetical protein